MPLIDLRDYILAKSGTWHTEPDFFKAGILKLPSLDDSVTLIGPAHVRVTVQAQNQLTIVGTANVITQTRDVYSYVLDLGPGQSWTYANPAGLVRGGAGANAGFGVVIQPAGPELKLDPRWLEPCSCCHCQPCCCKPPGAGQDLPCDFAVANLPNAGQFFPSPCDPCRPGAPVSMPPPAGAALLVPPASGGCVRTRYFNGMFITREDLETDQRNVRLKRKLQNRAMGQGVVWGLNVFRDGGYVCVLPGYGVDCCGNDITITAVYRVDGQALLRDPEAAAALARRGPHRFHLLLEYYECPQDPRPVHGDACSPETTRCEMARIRETARLRLVPPREVDASGPIADFLSELEALKKDPALLHLLTTPAPAGSAAPAADARYQVQVTTPLRLPQETPQPITLRPRFGETVEATVTRIISREQQVPFTVRLAADPNYQFAAGDVLQQTGAGGTVAKVTTPVGQLQWTTNVPFVQDQSGPHEAVFRFQGWQLAATAGGTSEAADFTEIRLRLLFNNTADFANDLSIQVITAALPPPPAPGPWPCAAEACDPDGKPRFPVLPPWLHEDPFHPGRPADPQVLVLAVLYALLASEMARNKAGTPQEVHSAQLNLATAVYQAVWRLFYATLPDTDRYQLTLAIQRLLAAWCQGFLYPGPRCDVQPDGVVIGCALVDGGEIQMVDPWGGRRWVVHYPLLAYWGTQVGIMPPDAIASRVFDLICCIASLPPPQQERADALPIGRGSVVPVGRSFVIFETPAGLEQRLKELGIKPARTVALNPVDFASRVWTLLLQPSGPPAPEEAIVLYTITGIPDVALAAPTG
jgi:hypothetical protein